MLLSFLSALTVDKAGYETAVHNLTENRVQDDHQMVMNEGCYRNRSSQMC